MQIDATTKNWKSSQGNLSVDGSRNVGKEEIILCICSFGFQATFFFCYIPTCVCWKTFPLSLSLCLPFLFYAATLLISFPSPPGSSHFMCQCGDCHSGATYWERLTKKGTAALLCQEGLWCLQQQEARRERGDVTVTHTRCADRTEWQRWVMRMSETLHSPLKPWPVMQHAGGNSRFMISDIQAPRICWDLEMIELPL